MTIDGKVNFSVIAFYMFLGFNGNPSTNPFDSQVNDEFAAVFGQPNSVDRSTGLGDILVPTMSNTGVPPAPLEGNLSRDQSTGDLHATLDRVAKSLGENSKGLHLELKINAWKVAKCKEFFQEFASQNKTCWNKNIQNSRIYFKNI